MAKKKLIGRNRPTARRQVRCYFCGHILDVSGKTLSTTCPGCHKAIKVEDVVIKTYLPVNDVQTCGMITVTKRGRIAARRVQSGDGVVCEGSIEGKVETPGPVQLGPKSSWKGPALTSKTLAVDDGAKLVGHVTVPCDEATTDERAEQKSKLVRRVQATAPIAAVDDDLFEQDEPVPKASQVTETKPTSAKPPAAPPRKKKRPTKKVSAKTSTSSATAPESDVAEAKPVVKVIRTRAVQPKSQSTAAPGTVKTASASPVSAPARTKKTTTKSTVKKKTIPKKTASSTTATQKTTTKKKTVSKNAAPKKTAKKKTTRREG